MKWTFTARQKPIQQQSYHVTPERMKRWQNSKSHKRFYDFQHCFQNQINVCATTHPQTARPIFQRGGRLMPSNVCLTKTLTKECALSSLVKLRQSWKIITRNCWCLVYWLSWPLTVLLQGDELRATSDPVNSGRMVAFQFEKSCKPQIDMVLLFNWTDHHRTQNKTERLSGFVVKGTFVNFQTSRELVSSNYWLSIPNPYVPATCIELTHFIRA